MSSRVVIIQHEDGCPPGWLGEGLDTVGVAFDVVQAHRGDALPTVPELDGLVVLGGQMSANDDLGYPWLGPTKRLIAQVVAETVPFLGICLGHQLACVALGGTVAPTPDGPTRGAVSVGLLPAAVDDPLLGFLQAPVRAVQWNNDVATAVPPGSELLAIDARGFAQALRLGSRAWGVQFHPEASAEIVSGWAESPARPGDHVDEIEAALGSVRDAASDLAATWHPLAGAFSRIVDDRRAARTGA